ncbi:hypothetical protein H6CHR_03067 [Variovorax sp. PBL-H6]|uniref:hypothetical protein n=1 Tax=Variovorax sp. PBL-H6 TaxID=434009 RepID=UPI001319532D|nr:hypothetical protein [Variovorax sp. PBL-H6]VTU28812.1 hypothetical protein H6CHR_03067 [Variovorax sp. PBL-H6]
MNKGYTTADYVAFSLVVTAGVVAGFYMAFGWKAIGDFLASQSTAAWIQAVGSIGAIVAAIEVARRQAVHSRNLQREISNDQAARSLSAVGALADMALQEFREAEAAVCSLREDASRWLTDVYTDTFYREFWKTIDAVPVHTLPTYESVAHVVRFKDIIACLEFNLQQLHLSRHPEALINEQLRLSHLQDNLHQLEKELTGFFGHLQQDGLAVKGRLSYIQQITSGAMSKR